MQAARTIEIVKETALRQLAERRANRPVPVDNAALQAGAEMYFYCVSCGALADIKPETYLFPARDLCSECDGLRRQGWLIGVALKREL